MANKRKILGNGLALAVFMALLFRGAAAAEDAAARLERHDTLIESLNATSERRSGVLDLIYNELRGPNRREMQESLREALTRPNSLIIQGAVEALAMLGDPRDVAPIEAMLATSRSMEVKVLALRVLPAFCLAGSERARFAFLRYATGYDRVADPAVLAPLRQPPLTRRGRLDAAREEMEIRIAGIVAGQFDPAGAALRHVDDQLYGPLARNAALHYAGGALGNDPAVWGSIWAEQGDVIASPVPDEIEEIRMAALHALADLGAEGRPETLAAFRRLLKNVAGQDVLLQTVCDSLAEMCRCAYADFDLIGDMRFESGAALEAEVWRDRHIRSAADLAAFAAGSAAAILSIDGDSGTFASAAACLGAALSYPDAFPDPTGGLAAASRAGLPVLEGMTLQPDLIRAKRAAAVAALGKIGTGEAVDAVAGVIDSPYCAPEYGRDAPLLAEAAIDGLRAAATGARDGRDTARRILLRLLEDVRVYPSPRTGAPPVLLGHMVLWRLQRLARSTEITLSPEFWRRRLGW